MHLQSHKFGLNLSPWSKREVQRPSQRSSESLLTDAQIVFEHTSFITSTDGWQILSLQRCQDHLTKSDTCYSLARLSPTLDLAHRLSLPANRVLYSPPNGIIRYNKHDGARWRKMVQEYKRWDMWDSLQPLVPLCRAWATSPATRCTLGS